MYSSGFDNLCQRIAAVLREYETEYPDDVVTISCSIAAPSVDDTHTVTGMWFKSANTMQKDINDLINTDNRSTEPPDYLENDLMCVTNAGHKDSALKLAQEIVKAYPSSPKAGMWLAEAYWRVGMLPEMQQTFEEALSIAESDDWLNDHDMTMAIKVKLLHGQILIGIGDEKAGREQLNAALQTAKSTGEDDKVQFVASYLGQYDMPTE